MTRRRPTPHNPPNSSTVSYQHSHNLYGLLFVRPKPRAVRRTRKASSILLPSGETMSYNSDNLAHPRDGPKGYAPGRAWPTPEGPTMWPTDVDYFEAVQSPPTRFADPELQQAEAVTNRMGLPVSCSGNFAVVFRLRSRQGQEWAVKCFTRPVANLQQRYAAIARHLQSRSLSCMVPFEYLERGIRVRNEWYPVVKMAWVQGLTCREFLSSNLQDKSIILGLMYLLWKLSRVLYENDISHGDIQHGNIMITTDGKHKFLRLVDYDGMWVPAVAGIPSGEYGHRHYQHPQRRGYYGPAMDHFPLLVMYTALYALSVSGDRGGMWQRYDQGDNILFTEGDFQEPGKSGLLRGLWWSGEEGLRRLVGHLVLGLRCEVDQVQPLGELVRYNGLELVELRALSWWQEELVRQILGLGACLGAGAVFRSGGLTVGPSMDQGNGGSREQLFGKRDVSELRLIHTLEGHRSEVNGVSVSGDGGVVVSGGEDGLVLVWDVASGKLRHTLAGHRGAVQSVSVSGDGRVVVSGGKDGQVLVWDGMSGQLRHRLKGHRGWVCGVAVSGDGRVVVSGGEDGQVLVWDGRIGQLRHKLVGRRGRVYGVSVSGDGRVVVSGGGDGRVRVWDGVSGQLRYTLRHTLVGRRGRVWGVSVSGNGQLVVSGGKDSEMRVVRHGVRWRWLHTLEEPKVRVLMWDGANGKLLRTLLGHNGWVPCVSVSRDGGVVVAGGSDGKVLVWK